MIAEDTKKRSYNGNILVSTPICHLPIQEENLGTVFTFPTLLSYV